MKEKNKIKGRHNYFYTNKFVEKIHIVPVARLEGFRALKPSNLEGFMVLKPYGQIGGF